MRHTNTLHTTCPCCKVSFQLTTDNVRQANFKRRFKKYDSLTKAGLDAALDADDPVDDLEEEDEGETWCHS